MTIDTEKKFLKTGLNKCEFMAEVKIYLDLFAERGIWKGVDFLARQLVRLVIEEQ